MNTPVASKSTFSSRSKMATLASSAQHQHQNGLAHNNNNARFKSNMPPPSTVARAASRPAGATPALSRIANLATYKVPVSSSKGDPAEKVQAMETSQTSGIPARLSSSSLAPSGNSVGGSHRGSIPVSTTNATRLSSTRVPPHTTSKIAPRLSSQRAPNNTRNNLNNLATPRFNGISALNSRSSSVVSSVSSTTLKRQSAAPERPVPETNVLRKGLAKFSNPIECQRQFQTLNLKIRQLNEVVEAREKEIDQLQEQLSHSVNIGTGYAITVQYFALKLKLDADLTLIDECAELKKRVQELIVNEHYLTEKLGTIKDECNLELKAEIDLKNSLKTELEETLRSHSNELQVLRNKFQTQLDLVNSDHNLQTNELEARVVTLQSDLNAKTKELTEVRKDFENLHLSYNKLEESLTKDKDARVKYAQEKIGQLQKDVESLNSVLEMKTERIHMLEKDSILLSEVQNELMICKDNNKSLSQQIESIKATLDTKREQLENLTVENEKLKLELKRERKERRRMTMRTEQLEYVLNESCAESSMFNSSLRDIDSADHVV